MLIQFVKRFLDGTPSVAEPVSTDNPLPVTMVGGGASGPQEVTAPAIGTPTDTAAAANGTGDITIVGALRRGLFNWATLFERIPALIAGRVPVQVLLTPFGDDVPINITDGVATASAAFGAGTVAVRIHKSAGVGVRVRVVNGGTASMTATQGRVLLPDFVGPVDVPAAPGQVLQVIRMSGDTGTGQVVATTLSA